MSRDAASRAVAVEIPALAGRLASELAAPAATPELLDGPNCSTAQWLVHRRAA
jgi:hypothetical protein